MSKRLVDNVNRMTHEELIGLAKNRYIDPELQMSIAKHYYARAHNYLAKNEGLNPAVRDYLWSDNCNKGYVLKSTLLNSGQYNDEPEKFWELYNNYPSMWARSRWRAVKCFIGVWSWSKHVNECPGDLLHEIYNTKLDPKLGPQDPHALAGMMNSYVQRACLEKLVRHHNCDLKLAIILSTCGDETVQRLAFEKIVKLSK